jgi:hypothetical protein
MSGIYSYSTGENKNTIYVFETKITYNDNTIVKKQLITDLNCGELITVKNDIKKLKISLCLLNTNKISETITIKKNINDSLENSKLSFLNDKLLITLIISGYTLVSINYNIL